MDINKNDTSKNINTIDDIFVQNSEIIKNQKKIMTDIKYNRIIFSICLVIMLFYIHSQVEELKDIISMLVQIFMN